MLIKFSTRDHADITLVNDVALRLLNMMGHSGMVPSAILGKNVPTAVEKLRLAVEHYGVEMPGPGGDGGDHSDSVRLARRARPLIELLEAAAAVKRDVFFDDR